uniref:Uncharacterized protein n=1 Tax=Manihot esculenta TaxID=3983 RepID=A0A2C9V6X8_MANES
MASYQPLYGYGEIEIVVDLLFLCPYCKISTVCGVSDFVLLHFFLVFFIFLFYRMLSSRE